MTCDTCRYRREPDKNQYGHGPATCSCPKFLMCYGETSLAADEVQVEGDEGWGFLAGPKFGCVHHEEWE